MLALLCRVDVDEARVSLSWRPGRTLPSQHVLQALLDFWVSLDQLVVVCDDELPGVEPLPIIGDDLQVASACLAVSAHCTPHL